MFNSRDSRTAGCVESQTAAKMHLRAAPWRESRRRVLCTGNPVSRASHADLSEGPIEVRQIREAHATGWQAVRPQELKQDVMPLSRHPLLLRVGIEILEQRVPAVGGEINLPRFDVANMKRLGL